MRRRWRRVVRSFVLSSDTRKGKEGKEKKKKSKKVVTEIAKMASGMRRRVLFFFLFSSHLRREEREFPVAEMCWFSSSLFGAIFGSPENPIDNTKLCCCQQRVHLVSSRVSFRHERRCFDSKLG